MLQKKRKTSKRRYKKVSKLTDGFTWVKPFSKPEPASPAEPNETKFSSKAVQFPTPAAPVRSNSDPNAEAADTATTARGPDARKTKKRKRHTDEKKKRRWKEKKGDKKHKNRKKRKVFRVFQPFVVPNFPVAPMRAFFRDTEAVSDKALAASFLASFVEKQTQACAAIYKDVSEDILSGVKSVLNKCLDQAKSEELFSSVTFIRQKPRTCKNPDNVGNLEAVRQLKAKTTIIEMETKKFEDLKEAVAGGALSDELGELFGQQCSLRGTPPSEGEAPQAESAPPSAPVDSSKIKAKFNQILAEQRVFESSIDKSREAVQDIDALYNRLGSFVKKERLQNTTLAKPTHFVIGDWISARRKAEERGLNRLIPAAK